MRRDWFNVWSAVAAILVLLGIPLKAQFAYVVDHNGNVYGYTINPSTGALTPIAGSPFAAGSLSRSVTRSHDTAWGRVAAAFSLDVFGIFFF